MTLVRSFIKNILQQRSTRVTVANFRRWRHLADKKILANIIRIISFYIIKKYRNHWTFVPDEEDSDGPDIQVVKNFNHINIENSDVDFGSTVR